MATSAIGGTSGISTYVNRGVVQAKNIAPKSQAQFERAQQNGAKAIRTVLAAKEGNVLNIQV